tara:strand:- start:167 stop:295 length:129 start_codon:yes stop_codon:yes gene_type:complete
MLKKAQTLPPRQGHLQDIRELTIFFSIFVVFFLILPFLLKNL